MTCYEITEGPGELDLIVLALARGMEVEFTIKTTDNVTDNVQHVRLVVKVVVKASIDGIKIEDGSRKNWLINGYVKEAETNIWQKFNGYFNTKTRTGWMEF